MSRKSRVPLQVSDKFAEKLKELQRKIRLKTGEERSLREITENMVKMQTFENFERDLLKDPNINMDIRIKFDRRLL